jgi:HNH endonuclease
VSAVRLRSKIRVDDHGCWIWTGRVGTSGYGLCHVRVEGRPRTAVAHRRAYELFVGPIPAGLHLDHLCRTPLCVNPGHLEPVTPQENNRRSNSPSARNARATHCVHGHPFDDDNTRISPDGARRCRRCEAHRVRRNYWRDKGIVEPPPYDGPSDRCPQGHLYDEANTARNGKGHRLCRACAAAKTRRRYWRKKAQNGLTRATLVVAALGMAGSGWAA